ncbi:MAG: ATP-binding cassette domain-containing protein, partial [[Eubacterium] saphenum]|nr:ATP-binding cassette domain-containing protein [[Eubacterium] saphenum]
MIRLEDVHKSFGDLEVLKGINLHVAEGEKLVIIGPSGSGKSTLIRCMNYLEEPTSGKVYIHNHLMSHKRRAFINKIHSSMVFQQFNLYPHLTVLDNLTLAPIKLKKVPKKEAEEIAMTYLKRVGLEEKAHVYPTTLSGGQQ